MSLRGALLSGDEVIPILRSLRYTCLSTVNLMVTRNTGAIMPPAARVTDTSNHGGTIVGPGVANVLIGGMPAAVAFDIHVCVIPPPPHVPVTPFPMGSATVLIGGRPALRVGDVCGCGASAAVGEPTVMIG